MSLRFMRLFILVLMVSGFVTAAAVSHATEKASQGAQPLYVGVTPEYPPLIFKQGDKITGIEAELAVLLGKELNRPVMFVELKWDLLIPALLDKKIDIIMSSMTATRERNVRIAFSDSYLKSSLVAGVRTGDAVYYPTVESIMNFSDLIGIIPNTTSEAFVKKYFPLAQQYYLKYPKEAVNALEQRWISMFVCDAPTMIWLVSENDSLEGIWQPLNDERLAWGIRKEDQNLLAHVNVALAQLRSDGRLDMVLTKWLPKKYLEKMK